MRSLTQRFMPAGNDRRSRGQSLVEFALTLPILVVLVIGVLDFGFAFHEKVIMENAARAGAFFMVYYKDGPRIPPPAEFYADTARGHRGAVPRGRRREQ